MRVIILILIICILSACDKPKKQAEIGSIKMTQVVEVTANDLAQVLLFTQDESERMIIFKKNFFDEKKDKKQITKEINTYKTQLEQYKGKAVIIQYHENQIGDKIFTSIELANPQR